MRPQPCVQSDKAHKHSHHGHTGNTQHSPRNGFSGLYRALPGDRALLPPSPALPIADLTPASGRQDHTALPSASKALSSAALLTSTASRPASVTIASRPSVGRDGASSKFDLPDGQSEIFLRAGLDREKVRGRTDLPVGQIQYRGASLADNPHGEEALAPSPDDASHRRENHEARGLSFETRAPDSASALPGERAPQEEARGSPTAPPADRRNTQSSCDRSWRTIDDRACPAGSTCTPEPARRMAGHGAAPQAGSANIDTLTQALRIIVGITLSDAGALLIGVFNLLRARREACGHRNQKNEALQLHRASPAPRPLSAPAFARVNPSNTKCSPRFRRPRSGRGPGFRSVVKQDPAHPICGANRPLPIGSGDACRPAALQHRLTPAAHTS
jgi:hypothetical protein